MIKYIINLLNKLSIPSRERWLWKNKKALASVKQGLIESSLGMTVTLTDKDLFPYDDFFIKECLKNKNINEYTAELANQILGKAFVLVDNLYEPTMGKLNDDPYNFYMFWETADCYVKIHLVNSSRIEFLCSYDIDPVSTARTWSSYSQMDWNLIIYHLERVAEDRALGDL